MVEDINKIDSYWRAANYYTVALMYLKDNILLNRKLEVEDLKQYSSGHWGTCPGINFILAHLNYFISSYGQKIQLTIGPGHAGNALFVNLLLEGTLQKYYSLMDDQGTEMDINKLQECISKIRTEINPSFPGTIYDGGELGYSLPVAFNRYWEKDLLNVCIIGDGEFETGTISSAWRTKVYFNQTAGKVLPIIHLNGYRMSDKTILSQYSDDQIIRFFEAMDYEAKIVHLDHMEMNKALVWAKELFELAEKEKTPWPVIILVSPKGYSAPNTESIHIQGNLNSHKNPLSKLDGMEKADYLQKWLESYKPKELFCEDGSLKEEVKEILPNDELKLGNTLSYYERKSLQLPNIKEFAISLDEHVTFFRNIKGIEKYLKRVIQLNKDHFIIISPDELKSNLLGDLKDCENNAKENCVWEILNENICQAWMQGYILSGRNALMISYEAFMPIITSMVSQYAKWIYQSNQIEWRKKMASMTYLLTSVWEANTFSHQNPAFVDQLIVSQEAFVRIYMPIDANTTLSSLHLSLSSENQINAIVCSKQSLPQYLNIVAAEDAMQRGLVEWEFCSSESKKFDLVLISAGDYCARECKEAINIIMKFLPRIHLKFVAVLELTVIGSQSIYAHAMDDSTFEKYFSNEAPAIFCYHGYASSIKALLFERFKKREISVLGYANKSIHSVSDLKKMQINGNSRYDIVMKACSHLSGVQPSKELERMMNYCKLMKKGGNCFD